MSQRLRQEPLCVGEREREAAGRVNTMAAAFCVDFGLQLTGRYCGRAAETTGRPTQRSVPAVLWQPRSRTLLRQPERSGRSLKRSRTSLLRQPERSGQSRLRGVLARIVCPSCASNQAACPAKTWHFTQAYARSREVEGNSAFIGSGKKK